MVFDPNSVPFHTVPMVAPGNVQVHVINSTLAKVHWDPVPLKSVRGHLQGYKVSTIKSLLFSFIDRSLLQVEIVSKLKYLDM